MKRILITIEDLFNLPGAVIYNPDNYRSASSVSIDSRNINKNSIFVAIKGGKFDGHNFVKDAADKGANAVVINKNKLKNFDALDAVIITVPNTIEAYGQLAKIKRDKLDPIVISLTGSSGKTTVKEMLFTILSEQLNTAKTTANNNNHIGVPLTILSASNSADAVILEHGSNHFGEIEYTSKIARPDLAIITNIGSSHLEFLKSKSGVLKEKISLFDETEKNGGTVFVNTDDPILRKLKNRYKSIVAYGYKNDPDVKGYYSGIDDLGRPKIGIQFKNKKLDFTLPVFGEANAKNILPAVAVALKLDIPKSKILSGIKKIKSVPGRLNVHEFRNSILVDDTYNSNPESLKNSVKTLSSIKKYKRKIFILGDMFELGVSSKKLHKEAVKLFRNSSRIEIYTLGKNMKLMQNELAGRENRTKHFSTRKSMHKFIDNLNLDNAVILVKGSRGMKMEDFLNQIKGII